MRVTGRRVESWGVRAAMPCHPMGIHPMGSPRDLFRGGKNGVFLDLSQPYRFQDAAGTTAATADSAPLGLVYDLKNGVPVLGASLTLLATTAQKTADGTTTINVLATSGVVGKAVRVQFTVASITGSFTVSSTGTGGTSVTISSTGVYDIVVMAGATGGNIKFEGLTTSRFSVTGIVIKELPGSHAYQATTTARPLLYTTPYYYAKFDLGDDVPNVYLPAITNGTICLLTNKGAWFDTLDFAGGVFSLGPTTYTGGPAGLLTALRNSASDFRLIGMVVIDKALSTAEKASLVAWGKSKGCPGEITLGGELVTNGGFDNAGSGWTVYSGTNVTFANNRLETTAAGNFLAGQEISGLSTSKFYLLSHRQNANGGQFYIRFGDPYTNLVSFPGLGQKIFILSPSTTPIGIYYAQSGLGVGSWIDDASIREVIFP